MNKTQDENPRIYRGHIPGEYVLAVALSPDGRRVASGGADRVGQVWDVETCAPIATYSEHHGVIRALAWSPDGALVASGGEGGEVHVWRAEDGGGSLRFGGHTDTVRALAWAPDGGLIASCGLDRTLRVWDARTGETVWDYQGDGNMLAVQFQPAGRFLAAGDSAGMLYVWDAHTEELVDQVRTHGGQSVNALAWSPDGERIATASDDDHLEVWQIMRPVSGLTVLDRPVELPAGHKPVAGVQSGDGGPEQSNDLYAVAWSPDGRRIAAAGASGQVLIWSWGSEEEQRARGTAPKYTYRGHSAVVWSLAWLPDGRRIVSGSHDSTVQVWSVPLPVVVADTAQEGAALFSSPYDRITVHSVRTTDLQRALELIEYLASFGFIWTDDSACLTAGGAVFLIDPAGYWFPLGTVADLAPASGLDHEVGEKLALFFFSYRALFEHPVPGTPLLEVTGEGGGRFVYYRDAYGERVVLWKQAQVGGSPGGDALLLWEPVLLGSPQRVAVMNGSLDERLARVALPVGGDGAP